MSDFLREMILPMSSQAGEERKEKIGFGALLCSTLALDLLLEQDPEEQDKDPPMDLLGFPAVHEWVQDRRHQEISISQEGASEGGEVLSKPVDDGQDNKWDVEDQDSTEVGDACAKSFGSRFLGDDAQDGPEDHHVRQEDGQGVQALGQHHRDQPIQAVDQDIPRHQPQHVLVQAGVRQDTGPAERHLLDQDSNREHHADALHEDHPPCLHYEGSCQDRGVEQRVANIHKATATRTPDSTAEKQWMKCICTAHASKHREVDSNQNTASRAGEASPGLPWTAWRAGSTRVQGGYDLSVSPRARCSSPGARGGRGSRGNATQ